MATSPNYGWSEPDNTSLVKDGAQAMRTLGDAIDTSVWNVGYGQAGKNEIINGDFFWNQRNFTSSSNIGDFVVDRWSQIGAGGGFTGSIQQFTTGTTLDGQNPKQHYRTVTSGQTAADVATILRTNIENVRVLAGQVVTISFWAKSASGTPKMAIETDQQFGTGGSPSSRVRTYQGQVTLSTTWEKKSLTFTMPSISGKTMGTNENTSYTNIFLWVSAGTNNNANTGSLGIQSNTFDIWGVQIEYGSQATPFQTASGGSIQGELAMCQRYYYRWTTGGNANAYSHSIFVYIGTEAYGTFPLPTTMRVNPTVLDTTGTAADYRIFVGGSFYYPSVVPSLDNSNNGFPLIKYTVASGLTAGQAGAAGANATNNTYLGFSAEL